jgi:hypothetical protein
MGKEKPISDMKSKKVSRTNQKMVQYNFTISDNELELWRQYAKDLGFPLARVIKETMNQAINKPKVENDSKNLFVDNLTAEISSIKEQMKTLYNQYFESLKGLTVQSTDLSIKDLIPRIRMFLQDLGSLSREKICDFVLLKDPSDEKRILVRKALSEMKEDGQIDYDIDNQTWRVLKRQP